MTVCPILWAKQKSHLPAPWAGAGGARKERQEGGAPGCNELGAEFAARWNFLEGLRVSVRWDSGGQGIDGQFHFGDRSEPRVLLSRRLLVLPSSFHHT